MLADMMLIIKHKIRSKLYNTYNWANVVQLFSANISYPSPL